MPYVEAWKRQLRLWRDRLEGRIGDTLVSCQHPPTITLGRHGPIEDVRAPDADLRRRGVRVVRSDRGGRATVHAPGQAVVYPIVALEPRGLAVRAWVDLLEECAREVLAGLGIAATRRPGRPGLWTERGKIAFIGLRVARGVSYHGLAVNVDLDVSLFDCIVPCGAAADRITSVAIELGGCAPPANEVGRALCRAIHDRLATSHQR